MIVVELREALLDRALDLLDEAKKHGKKCKLAMCELEDTLYECYESSKDDDEDYEDYEDFEAPDYIGDEDMEILSNYRDRRLHNNRRRALRMRYHNDADTLNSSWRRSANRMHNAMRLR